jgi:phosphohistidine phosphatase
LKTLLLIRHAKSSWDGDVSSDFDRPLNERGKKDAPEMAKRLIRSGMLIDLFVSSPAKRAKKTAELFAREFHKPEDEILFIPQLYHAVQEDFHQIIRDLDPRYNHIAVFSHNPGITDFANSLTEMSVDNMPTCSIFAVRVPIVTWEGFSETPKEFLRFDYPKSIITD